MPQVVSLFRYPIKGFSGESLETVSLQVAQGFPHDRQFAISNGRWTYDPATYDPVQKVDFVALMANNRVTLLRLAMHGDGESFELHAPDGTSSGFRYGDEAGMDRFIDFLVAYLKLPETPRPRLYRGGENAFTDGAMLRSGLHGTVSLINLASVRDLARRMDLPSLDPMRFRANVYVDGVPAWQEREWVGHSVLLGDVETKAIMATPRCGITMINPDTAKRDAPIPQALKTNFGHIDIGINLDVTKAGVLEVGDTLQVRHDTTHAFHESMTVLLNNVSYTFLGRKKKD